MDFKEALHYVYIAIKVIFVILLIYFIYVGWVFFSTINTEYKDKEIITQQCNSFLNLENNYDFCCVKRKVLVGGNAIESTCYGFKQTNSINEINDFDCSRYSCFIDE